ncbi:MULTISPECIES: GNAT family N-acetyltransferase [Vibrio]|uniref:GNAT family N-acetyltransferase n=1 Tax=Vibrio TaxID=662 RepID=UPI000C9DD4BB|nr:GNAT family N-acetyltransferase [Vibrio diazotrophicus]PNH80674.1 GNAT family N-acetyltransferase [Vibrio diazotrophicus]PNH91589.1 GNAT family N-acetyltransferase [Vibrio diazotrophicus]PNH97456.1 GNAT family N-acetyltransferase [Vibrio diazotrophicus]
MKIREGSLSEVVTVVTEIDEFIVKENEQSLAQRLEGKRHLILVAEQQGQILGFKIGYELDSDTFYSWFGGVSPKARNLGLAQKLLDVQESWVIEQGYQQLKVKSRNQFPAMLRLLLRNNYLIENFEPYEPLLESRIHFVKQLKNK